MTYTNSADYEKDRAEALKTLEAQKVTFSFLDKIIPNDGKPTRITNLFYDLLQYSKFKDDPNTNIQNSFENSDFLQILRFLQKNINHEKFNYIITIQEKNNPANADSIINGSHAIMDVLLIATIQFIAKETNIDINDFMKNITKLIEIYNLINFKIKKSCGEKND